MKFRFYAPSEEDFFRVGGDVLTQAILSCRLRLLIDERLDLMFLPFVFLFFGSEFL